MDEIEEDVVEVLNLSSHQIFKYNKANPGLKMSPRGLDRGNIVHVFVSCW